MSSKSKIDNTTAKQWSTEYYTENIVSSNAIPLKLGVKSGAPEQLAGYPLLVIPIVLLFYDTNIIWKMQNVIIVNLWYVLLF